MSTEPSGRRPLVLVAGLVAILLWQYVFFRHGDPDTALASPYRVTASSGVLQWQPEFVYFLYYLNLYPVASISNARREYSVEGARRLIAEQGQTLVMDRYWTVRYGELAKTYLYLPHAWWKGRPVRPRMLHANALGFTLALLVLWGAFWRVGRSALGALLVVLIGSNPFQVHSVFAENNLLGWPITVTVLMLGLHVSFMRDRPPRFVTAVAVALASGAILGTVRQVRTEPTLVILAVTGVYLTARGLRAWRRATLVAVIGATFIWTAAAWTRYFEGKYTEAYRVVKAAGGHTYEGTRHPHHFFWHALWCGLGDFDQKYGHIWSDVGAMRYAWPILQRRGFRAEGFSPDRPDYWDHLTLGVYWDKGRQYARTAFETPEYIDLMREKVLADVGRDPRWYASIIGRRVLRLLSASTPPTVALGNGVSIPVVPLVPQPLWGYGTVLLGVWLLKRRDWFRLKLLAFTLPLVTTPLLVYSGLGTPFYSITHLVAVAIVGAGAWEWLMAGRSGRASLRTDLVSSLRVGPGAWRWLAGLGVAGILVLVSVVGLAEVARRVGTRSTPPAHDGPPLVAVLPFDNETSDAAVAWVGDALGELLAARLEAAGVRTLGPDAVRWLDPDTFAWHPDGTLIPRLPLAANIVADRSAAHRVVAGRVRANGEGLLACVEVLAPPEWLPVGPELCGKADPDSLFEAEEPLVRAVLPVLGATGKGAPPTPPASSAALRLYTEARRAIRAQEWGESVRLLEESLREDPRFLPARVLRERLSLSGWQVAVDAVRDDMAAGSRPLTLEGLRAEVSKAPEAIDARVDLGRVLVSLELFDDAAAILTPLLSTPGVPAEAFGVLAKALAARGDMASGYQALLECRRRSWGEPTCLGLMADHLTAWGEFGQARQNLDEAGQSRRRRGMAPITIEDLIRRWRIHALENDWARASQAAFEMKHLDDPRAAGVATLHLALGHLFEGRSRLAGALAEEAAFRFARNHQDAADAISTALEVHLDRGDAVGALELIREARVGKTRPLDRRVAFWEPIALARVGRWAEADRARNRLGERLQQVPGPSGQRLVRRLDGELSLQRGAARQAVSSLTEAARLLPPRGFCGDHVPIWYALSRAHLASGDVGQAEAWLEKVAGASWERLCWPIPYARSLALLGRIRAAADRPDQAAEVYERYLALWGDGDLDATDRNEARQFLLAQASDAHRGATVSNGREVRTPSVP